MSTYLTRYADILQKNTKRKQCSLLSALTTPLSFQTCTVFWRWWQNERVIHSPHRIRAWFCCSAGHAVPSPTLITLALLCKQMFSLSFVRIYILLIGIRHSFESNQEFGDTGWHCIPQVHPERWQIIKRLKHEAKKSVPLFTTPVMRCSEQRRRTTGIQMAKTGEEEDTC